METIAKNLVCQMIGTQDNFLGEFIKRIPEEYRDQLTNIMGLYAKLLDCIENHMENEFCFSIILNTVIPTEYQLTYFYTGLNEMLNNIKVKENREEEFDQILKEIITEENIIMLIYIVHHILKPLDQMIPNSGIEELDNKAKKIIEADKSMIKDFPPVTLKNVKLYHGTSYDNYLDIKKEGFIRPSDYSDGNYQECNHVKELYVNETGYLFTIDSMDFPIRYCFGGQRKNLIESWAYDRSGIEHNKYNPDLGVIFEIDPTNYKVYFNRLKKEFMIKGSVSLKDVRPMFYHFLNNEFIEITEEEMAKLWRNTDGVCN